MLADVGAPDGHGDDLGATGVDGLARLLEIDILAGTHQKPR